MENKIISVVGPTASGKTALAIALAKKLNTEIISADSMQIYKELSVGTAKPTIEEMQGIPHHLIDIMLPSEEFSVAKFSELADEKAQELLSRSKIPIVCGGTGLYLNALIEGNKFENNERNSELREKLWQEYEEFGALYMHDKLKAVDTVSAENIHMNNVKRVLRALEVYIETGIPLTELNKINKAENDKYKACIIGICPNDREVLYNRINLRVDLMLEAGLLEEAKKVFEYENLSQTAKQAIGYKEFFPYFKDEMSLEECAETLKRNTRKYAKRQLTWFRRDSRVKWILYNENDNFESIFQNSTKVLEEFGVQ